MHRAQQVHRRRQIAHTQPHGVIPHVARGVFARGIGHLREEAVQHIGEDRVLRLGRRCAVIPRYALRELPERQQPRRRIAHGPVAEHILRRPHLRQVEVALIGFPRHLREAEAPREDGRAPHGERRRERPAELAAHLLDVGMPQRRVVRGGRGQRHRIAVLRILPRELRGVEQLAVQPHVEALRDVAQHAGYAELDTATHTPLLR